MDLHLTGNADADRLEAPLDAASIAAMDPDELDRLFRTKPALHRYPGSMATRVHALCQHVVGEYGAEGYRSIADVTSPDTLLAVREHKQAMKRRAKATS